MAREREARRGAAALPCTNTRKPIERVSSESWALAAAMVAGGSSAEVIDAGDHAHGALDTAIGEPTDEVVTPPVGRFLGSCLR